MFLFLPFFFFNYSKIKFKQHEYISTYIPYFNNYENSYDTIEKCMKVPTFEESIKMVEGVKKLERNDLKSLLILPVQRLILIINNINNNNKKKRKEKNYFCSF